MRLKALALSLILAALGGRAWADASAPFLWEVRGAQVSHYLLGSVHVLAPSDYPLPAALASAYALTDVLMLETDPDALTGPELQQATLTAAQSEQGLSAEVPAALLQSTHQHLRALGVPESLCDPFRAWFCAVSLEMLSLQAAGFQPESGLDLHFAGLAHADQRSIRWLESPKQQLDLLSGMPDAQAKLLLESTLESLDAAGQRPQDLIAQWRRGDVAAVAAAVADMQREFPALYQRILAQRNLRWIPQLRQAFAGAESYLVVVGSAHLVGTDSVPELLRKAGYEVRPVRCADRQWAALCMPIGAEPINPPPASAPH